MKKKIKTYEKIQKDKLERKKKFLHSRVRNRHNKPIESITFIRNNDQRVVQNVNPQFFTKQNGKNKTNSELVDDIISLQHDMNAKYLKL